MSHPVENPYMKMTAQRPYDGETVQTRRRPAQHEPFEHTTATYAYGSGPTGSRMTLADGSVIHEADFGEGDLGWRSLPSSTEGVAS